MNALLSFYSLQNGTSEIVHLQNFMCQYEIYKKSLFSPVGLFELGQAGDICSCLDYSKFQNAAKNITKG